MAKLISIGDNIINADNVLWIKKGSDPRIIEVRYTNDTDYLYFKDENERDEQLERLKVSETFKNIRR
jgi:hypothetical protein